MVFYYYYYYVFFLLLVYGSDFPNIFSHMFLLYSCVSGGSVEYGIHTPLDFFLKNFSFGDMVRLYNLSVIHCL